MKDERFVEAGCSGTAAVISPIGKIQYKGATREFGDGLTPGSVMRMLHGRLTAIQLLEAPDIYGWVHEVNMRSIA
jgi:branched-chain amino acid aminotransferase